MPSSIVASFAKKTGKSVEDVEALWKKAKVVVKDEFSDIDKESDKYFQIVTGVLKKMLKIEESFSKLQSIIFPMDKYSLEEAKRWLKRNDFDFSDHKITGKTWVFDQENERLYTSLEVKPLREDVSASSGTVSGNIAVPNISLFKRNEKGKICPDSTHMGKPCFDVESSDYFRAAAFREKGARYKISNEKVKAFMRESGYRSPFLIKYENNYLQVK